MKRLLLILLLLTRLALPVEALELEAPEVPSAGAEYMPSQTEDLGQAVVEMVRDILLEISPQLKLAMGDCGGVLCALLLCALLGTLPGAPGQTVAMAGVLWCGYQLLRTSDGMVALAVDTVGEISEYGKLLLPTMSAALAAQGGVTASTALYAGTALFDAVLSRLINLLLVPQVYLYLGVSIGAAALGEGLLTSLRDQLRSILIWCLKTVMYIFTGYISVTGVVSGATDAAALKAAKLTISGVVPVVGGILSDASEAVLVTASTISHSIGIYGMLAVLAIWVGPFLRIGVYYLSLKVLAALCGIFGEKRQCALVGDFAAALGLLLAMTGAVCVMLLISLLCFFKGVG